MPSGAGITGSSMVGGICVGAGGNVGGAVVSLWVGRRRALRRSSDIGEGESDEEMGGDGMRGDKG